MEDDQTSNTGNDSQTANEGEQPIVVGGGAPGAGGGNQQ